MLEIHSSRNRSLQSLDLGDAVFCCDVSSGARRPLEATAGHKVFVAECSCNDTTVYVDVAYGVKPWGNRLGTRRKPSSRATTVPVYGSTLAAGIVVAEFVRFTAGEHNARTIQLDIKGMRLTVEE